MDLAATTILPDTYLLQRGEHCIECGQILAPGLQRAQHKQRVEGTQLGLRRERGGGGFESGGV